MLGTWMGHLPELGVALGTHVTDSCHKTRVTKLVSLCGTPGAGSMAKDHSSTREL